MKKIMLSLLLIGIMILSGCGRSNNEITGNGIAVSTENGKKVISSTEEMIGGEYIITPAVQEKEIVAGTGNLMTVAVEDGQTRVAVTAIDGTIEKGAPLFKLLADNSVEIKSETIVTEDNYNSLTKKATKSGIKGYRVIAANTLLGDFNNDNTVDIKDFVIFSSNYATTNTTYDIAPASLGTVAPWTDIYSQKNSDGKVDIFDLIIFGRNYGKSVVTGITVKGDSTVVAPNSITLTASTSAVWAISDSTVATLNTTSGTTVTLTGIKTGTVQVTATSGANSATHTVTVSEIIKPTVTAVTVSGALTVDTGKTTTLTSTVKYSDGTTNSEAVEWTTSDATVAKLSAASGVTAEVTGVKAGTATITATKNGKSITATVTVKPVPEEPGITVYVEKPDAWTEIYMWYDSDLSTPAWDTSVLKGDNGKLTLEDGWYKRNFPTSTKVTFLFNNGTWDSKLDTTGVTTVTQTTNFTVTATTWITKDGKTYDTNPKGPTPAGVSASQASGTFSTDGLDVTLNVSGTGVTSGKYVVNGTDASNGTVYTNGTKITVGKGLSKGEKVTLTLYATDGTTPATKTYTYEKTDVVVIESTGDFNEIRMYQINVSSFMDGDTSRGYSKGYGPGPHNGDLRGIINSLDYIKSLNVNAIWMTPVFQSGSAGQFDDRIPATGYFADDFFKIDNNFGSDEDFRELVKKAHEKGLYVILDGVFGHHGKSDISGVVNGGEQGKFGYWVKYPASLDYFKRVAKYWIEEYDIDGWRLDQAYQLGNYPHDGKAYQDKNYLVDIREAVEASANKNKLAGKKWGTLGYIVGEIWDGEGTSVLKNGYTGYDGKKALLSNFDFPGRYKLVQTLAAQERNQNGSTINPYSNDGDASALNAIFSTPDKIPGVYPNMFITNHDVLRMGDLIQRKGLGQYWERCKASQSFLAAYTGPITLYYGDEYGAEVAGYVKEGDGGHYDDNCARDPGKTSGFNAQQQDMLNYVTKLLKIRAENPALWRGKRTNLVASGQQYADLKTDEKTGQKVVYLLNTKTGSTTFNISAAGSSFTDLETGAAVGTSVAVDGLSAKFLLVK